MVTALDYLWSILLNNNCKDCFAFLICYYLYPLCVPNKPDKTIWKKRQKLCRQTCYFLYNDLSGGKTAGLSTMTEKFTRARFGNDLEFQNNVRNILNFGVKIICFMFSQIIAIKGIVFPKDVGFIFYIWSKRRGK